MSLEEKRQHYSCGNNYKTLSDIPTMAQTIGDQQTHEEYRESEIRHKISLYLGDITTLEVDAIVNAANDSLEEGGGDIIHTVGPIGENAEMLRRCYRGPLELMAESGLHSIAFPCISTGVYGYPTEAAVHVAIGTVKQWLLNSPFAKHTNRVIFCCFGRRDYEIYNELFAQYFPINRL